MDYMSNNQLKYIILAGLFIVPFVPFVVASSLFFPFITGKAFLFRVIVEIILAAYLVLILRDESYRPKFSWIFGSLAAFLAVMGVADIFGENPFKSFWSNFERMEGYITLLHFGAYFLVMSSVFKTQELWNRLLATSVFASAIMAVYSFFQLAGKIAINQGGVRVDGTLGNASYLAVYMVFHLFFAAILFVRLKGKWQRVLLALSALANLVVLYATATRGAILGFIGGLFITFIYLLFKSNKGDQIRKIAAIGLFVMAALVGLFIGVKDTSLVQNSPVLSRFATLSFSEIKNQGRYYVWPIAVKGFIEKPVLGWGQEGFNFVFNKYYDPRMYTQEAWFDRAHSTPLDWLIAGGLLGLLAYLSVIFFLFYYIFRIKDDSISKEEKALMLGLVAAYVFNNLFVFDQTSSYILFFTVLAYVHSHFSESRFSWWEKISSGFKNIFVREKWRPLYEALVLVLAIASLYFFVYAPWQQNKSLLHVLSLNNQGQIGSLQEYRRPLEGYSMGFPEALEHVSQTVMGLASNPALTVELRGELFDLVDQSFQKQIAQVPDDARYRLFYGAFLGRFGWYGRAVEQLKAAQALSPRKQQIYFELMNYLVADKKTEEAVAVAKEAYELEPSYQEARFVYGLSLLASGGNSAEILKDIPESKIVFDDRYISVLLSLGRFDQIIEVVKKRIELEPTNLQHRITLTAAYLQANRRPEAIVTLQELIALEPSFKEKGEYYISEIRAGRNP